jgi:integrase
MERAKTRYPSIYEYPGRHGKSRYQVVYREGRGPGARQRARSFSTMTQARDFQISTGHSLREGTYHDPNKGKVPLAEFFEEYMRRMPPPEQKTRSSYRRNFELHVSPVLGPRDLNDIGPGEAAELLEIVRTKRFRSGDGRATLRQVYALGHRLFEVAKKLGRLPHHWPNPFAGLDPGIPDPRDIQPLEVWELEDLARAMRDRYRPMVLLMGYAGLRIGETCALQWKHLDLKDGIVKIRRAYKEDGGQLYLGTPKDDDVREVYLFPEVTEALQLHRTTHGSTDRDTLVFTNTTGGVLWPMNFRRRELPKAAKAAGLGTTRLTPHVLRHTAASLMARAGWPEAYIQQALGHGSTAMTRRYVHLYRQAHLENRDRLALLVRSEAEQGSAEVVSLS